MDFQNRVGSKPGSGGVLSSQDAAVHRRERLRKLALETIDLAKDPYFMRNHLGSFECKLCLTLHPNEGSYLAHTQGKKHQGNLGRRAAREARESNGPMPLMAQMMQQSTVVRSNIIKIGRPGYKVTKVRDTVTLQIGILFQIHYPHIGAAVKHPRYRFMSAFEQRIEAPNKAYQYLLFSAEPYENIGFKVETREIDRGPGRLWSYWDADSKLYTLQLMFKSGTGAPNNTTSGGVVPAMVPAQQQRVQ